MTGACLRRHRVVGLAVFVLVALCLAAGQAFAQGRIDGAIKSKNGSPVGGVIVVLNELSRAEVSNDAGRYAFGDVTAGSYTLTLTLGNHTTTERVVVTNTAAVTTVVDWQLAFAETVVVTGVSKHVERIVESPASVSRISGEELAREAADTQLPRRLAHLPGVELTQSSLYTFSLNARGFNTPNGRHLPMFIDGRDASTPVVLGNQEWGALTIPIDELASIEVVRGPAAALYGSGAFSGVVNAISKAPGDALGGRVRVTFGQLGTFGGDARYAAKAANGWSYRVSGALQQSRDFARSRVSSVEYAGLANEVIPLPDETIRLMSGSVRVDRATGGRLVTLEGGASRAQGVTAVTSLGRSFSTDVRRPWARVNASWSGWNAMASYTGRDARDLKNLGGGNSVYLRESNIAGEVQRHRLVARGRGHVVAGASFARQSVDSASPSGAQTVFAGAQAARQEAVFAQVDWNLTPQLKAVASGRWDDSSLHEGRFSPRAALVFSPAMGQTFRANYSHAFQSPSLVEFYLNTPVAAPVDLSPLQAALAPLLGGVSLGFSGIPVLAVGNRRLNVERIESFDVGYTGVLGTRILATTSLFYNRRHDFTTSLVPQAGSSLGRVNPDYQPYAPPSTLSAAASAAVVGALQASLPRQLFSAMSNDASGQPVFALLSFGNFGEARDHGLELALTVWARPDWRVDAAYTWMDFSVPLQAAENVIASNAPGHQFSAGTTYAGTKTSGSLKLRTVSAFDWTSGVYSGRVPSYVVVDGAAAYAVRDGWRLDLDAANLFDDRHFEAYGGSLLGRRVLASVVHTW